MNSIKIRIRPCEARKILGISRGTFNKWVSENIIKVAGRLKSTQEKPLGERRFDLDHILELKKEMYPNKK